LPTIEKTVTQTPIVAVPYTNLAIKDIVINQAFDSKWVIIPKAAIEKNSNMHDIVIVLILPSLLMTTLIKGEPIMPVML